MSAAHPQLVPSHASGSPLGDGEGFCSRSQTLLVLHFLGMVNVLTVFVLCQCAPIQTVLFKLQPKAALSWVVPETAASGASADRL